MDIPFQSTLFVSVAGGLGGGLNGLLTDNRFWWPSGVTVAAGKRLVRPGLLVNAAIGSAAAKVLHLLGGSDLLAAPLPGLAAAAITGWLAARCLSSAVDNRLLRAALSKACCAPAAHPDATEALIRASPYAAFEAACELTPPSSWATTRPGARPPNASAAR